ncbi:Cytochrome b561 [Aphelenchoides fujianensis]|nr:Cytochrome b561 [Aphelenchoides fujianensis]
MNDLAVAHEPQRQSRLRRLRNSLAPTGDVDVSFASIYSASSAPPALEAKADPMFSFDFFVGLSHALLITFCGLLAYVFGASSQRVQFGGEDEIAGFVGNLDFPSLIYAIALLVVQGEALVVHRVHRHEMRFVADLLQVALHLVGVVLAVLLLVALVQHKNRGAALLFASFHAWLSVLMIAGFLLQGLVSLVGRVFPAHLRQLRRSFTPTHRIFSTLLVVLSAVQIITGLQEYTGALGSVSVNNGTLVPSNCYVQNNCPHNLGAILNIAILFLIGYVVTITSLVANVQWKRKPTIDERRTA